MSPVAQRDAMGCDSMGTRLVVQDGAYPDLRFIRGDLAPVRQEWRCLGLEPVNDNDPDRQAGIAEMERNGAPDFGGGPE
jgi:hypothetical protein